MADGLRPDVARHAPQRTCIGCRRTTDQHDLIRCAAAPGGSEVYTVGRHAPGRGAWLCSLECFDVARRRRAFARAWKRNVDDAALQTLRNDLERVISKMEHLPDGGPRPDQPAPMKG